MGVLSYLKEPLALLGIVLLLAFFIFKYLLKHGYIKRLSVQLESKTGQLFISYGYIFALLLVFLGVGLRQNEINESGQIYASTELKSEYEDNISTLKQLSENADETLYAYKRVFEHLHSDDSKILSTIFPKLNRSEKAQTAVNKQVTASFETLKSLKLLKSKSHMAAFNATKVDIDKQLTQQLQLLSERQDKSGELYSMKDATWRNYREVLEEIDDFNVPAYKANLQQMNSLLRQYRNTLKQTENFFTEISEFTKRNTFLSNGDVYEILIKEQSTEKALTEFVTDLRSEIAVIEQNTPSFKLN